MAKKKQTKTASAEAPSDQAPAEQAATDAAAAPQEAAPQEAATAAPEEPAPAEKKPAPRRVSAPPPASEVIGEGEEHAFQAETRQLLDIVIHSLYTNKEIFLRELISNASDALDRLRFEALTRPELLAGDEQLEIRLEADADARTLTVRDNGIGMSREEVITNIGTIAKSGTRELMTQVKESGSSESMAQLIGQFGVGFYSSFMVAERVSLLTRRAGEETATYWESTGDGRYVIRDAARAERGTSITLHLLPVDKDAGVNDYTEIETLERIVKRHSDFVAYPIVGWKTARAAKQDAEGKATTGLETVIEDKVLNSQKPIWTRPQSEVKQEEYTEFYKHISHDWNDPFDTLWLHAEGRLEYQALLFIPSKAPFDLYAREQHGLQLYVRRVLIMDRCEELMPSYLRFIRGVVDSADLPLNISRQNVQQDRHITQIRKWLVRKVLDHLQKMLDEERDKYLKLWAELGRILKEGVNADFDNRDRVKSLLLFPSSHDPEKLTTLKEYVSRMKDDQNDMFYIVGESRAIVESSPHLEAFRDKGYEVLYLTDPIDDFLTQSLNEFDDYKLQSVGKGDVELGTEEERKQAKEELKEKRQTYAELMKLLERTLDDWVKEVRLSNRLTTSPVCLVAGEFDMSPQYERFLRQTEGAGKVPTQKRILELNPNHELLAKMQERYDKDRKDPVLKDYAHLLHGYALLAEGSDLPDPAKFNKVVGELMMRAL